MKKVFIPAVIFLIAAFYFGCSKKKEIKEFDMFYNKDVAIPTFTMANQTYSFNTSDMVTDINNQLSQNGTNGNLVGEISITGINVSVKSPTIQSANFIRQMKLFMNTTGQPELQVAYKYNDKNDSIYPTAKSTNLKLNSVNLKNRFVENTVYYRINLMPGYIPPPTTITISHTVHVKSITE